MVTPKGDLEDLLESLDDIGFEGADGPKFGFWTGAGLGADFWFTEKIGAGADLGGIYRKLWLLNSEFEDSNNRMEITSGGVYVYLSMDVRFTI